MLVLFISVGTDSGVMLIKVGTLLEVVEAFGIVTLDGA